MDGRSVRSETAQKVSEVIGSRDGREFLDSYGWIPGMPIIVAQHTESLNDVMGLASMHPGPVFVATLEPVTGKLRFLYVSPANPSLQVVSVAHPERTLWDLFLEASAQIIATFRVKYWDRSAVAHALPEMPVIARTLDENSSQDDLGS